ncbi:hypothetical protein BCR39DRAFT_549296 [Naematelia encephala]|uniref:BTB domain-containing protein n=1 Tax=Naematelia encephala TaxID=71784 RepID=A0A1Y2ALQ9_9TREE|nr:hypothetical protein BCR39DRAFT_549296 [Naematelia encephala]
MSSKVVPPSTPSSGTIGSARTATPSSSAYSTSVPSTTMISSQGTMNGDQGKTDPTAQAEDSKLGESSVDPTHHAAGLSNYIFDIGYMGQNWADIQLVFFGAPLRLHRLILSQSPYLAHIMVNAVPGCSLDLSFTDENITADSVHIAIHHLYRPAQHLVTPTNARAVLATSYLFQGMPELVHHAYSICRDSLSAENVVDYVQWLNPSASRTNGHGHQDSSVSSANTNGGSETGNLWLGGSHLQYGEWTERLKQDVLDFLIQSYPRSLLESGSSPTSDPQLLSIFTRLPFELFQLTLESPLFPIDNIQQRFAFAKKAIAQRKKLAGASTMDEAVVLAMKGGAGMEVHITRKPKNKRQALWKVEG